MVTVASGVTVPRAFNVTARSPLSTGAIPTGIAPVFRKRRPPPPPSPPPPPPPPPPPVSGSFGAHGKYQIATAINAKARTRRTIVHTRTRPVLFSATPDRCPRGRAPTQGARLSAS